MTSNGVPRLQADWWRLPKSPANTSATAARSVSLRREAPQRRTCWRQTERARLRMPRRGAATRCAAPPLEGGPARRRAPSSSQSHGMRGVQWCPSYGMLGTAAVTRMQMGCHAARHASCIAAWSCNARHGGTVRPAPAGHGGAQLRPPSRAAPCGSGARRSASPVAPPPWRAAAARPPLGWRQRARFVRAKQLVSALPSRAAATCRPL